MQEVTSDEEIESNAKRGDSNRVYIDNPQEKEDFTKATSKREWKHQDRLWSAALIAFSRLESNMFSTALKISWDDEGYWQVDIVL